MGDYPSDELLLRMRVQDRLRQLSDLFLEAQFAGDDWALSQITLERERLWKEWIKVVQ